MWVENQISAWTQNILIFIIVIYAWHLNKWHHFVIVIFISSSKRHGLFPIFKMADQQPTSSDNFRGMGRVNILLEVIEEFHRRGEVKDLPPHHQGADVGLGHQIYQGNYYLMAAHPHTIPGEEVWGPFLHPTLVGGVGPMLSLPNPTSYSCFWETLE